MLPFSHDSNHLSPSDFTRRDRIMLALSLPLLIVGIFAWLGTVGLSPLSIPAGEVFRWAAITWVTVLWFRYQ